MSLELYSVAPMVVDTKKRIARKYLQSHEFGTKVHFHCYAAGKYVLSEYRSVVVNVVYPDYYFKGSIIARIEGRSVSLIP